MIFTNAISASILIQIILNTSEQNLKKKKKEKNSRYFRTLTGDKYRISFSTLGCAHPTSFLFLDKGNVIVLICLHFRKALPQREFITEK